MDSSLIGPGVLFLNQYFNEPIDDHALLPLCLVRIHLSNGHSSDIHTFITMNSVKVNIRVSHKFVPLFATATFQQLVLLVYGHSILYSLVSR